MTSTSRVIAALVVSAGALSPLGARADWPTNAAINLPICTAANNQVVPSICTDMTGGAFIAWEDMRNNTDYNVFAQRVTSTGVVDAAWPVNGLLVCGATGAQEFPEAISDGAGGALVAWRDGRSGTSQIYMHHLLASGAVDAAWPVNGLAVCPAAGAQEWNRMVTDGAGGAVVVWRDTRNDTDLFAMRVLASGVPDPAWPSAGVALAAGPGSQQCGAPLPVVSDGHGGLFVTWKDTRSSLLPDIYAQHLLVNGSVAAGWPANGLAVCTAPGIQEVASISPDVAGGVYIGWQDLRAGLVADIYAQRVRANGTVDPAWPADGLPVCAEVGNQTWAILLAEPSGGAFIGWTDARAGGNPALYAHRLLSGGSVDPGWPAGGFAFNPLFGTHFNLALLPDGYGGALAVWDDGRNGLSNEDIYAQHILVSGGLAPGWPSGGFPVSTAIRLQNASGAAIQDGSGGLIVTWADNRALGSTPLNVYAQRMRADGTLGGTVLDVPRAASPGASLRSVLPNPGRGDELRVLFSGPAEPGAMLQLLDVTGRVVASKDLDGLGAADHEVRFDGLRSRAPGLYFVTLRHGLDAHILRVAVIR